MTAVDRSAWYCRRARRLRAQLAHRPAAMHRTLHQLSREAQVSDPPVRAPAAQEAFSQMLGVAPGAAEAFARLSSESIRDAMLTFDRRESLFRAAQRMGIDRFTANLILAATQNRQVRGGVDACTGLKGARSVREVRLIESAPRGGQERLGPDLPPRVSVVVAFVLAVETVLLWLGWHFFIS